MVDATYNSVNKFTGDGTKVSWELNFAGGYLNPSHIFAYTTDASRTKTVRSLSFSGPNTVVISPAVAAGIELTVYRTTPSDGLITAFSDGTILNASTLNTASTQAIFIAAEAVDLARGAEKEFPAITGFTQINGTFALNSLGLTAPSYGTFFGTGGNSVSFQTLVSSPVGAADNDNQRAAVLIAATTTDDGNSEEQTLCLLTKVQTGYNEPWQASHAYAVGANVSVPAQNALYRCTTAGTSAASGGPTGTGTGIADGTAVWKWINAQAIDAKCSLYNEIVIAPGAGHSWAQANNMYISAGVHTDYLTNTELDMFNGSGHDAGFGTYTKYLLDLNCYGTNTSSAFINITTLNTSKKAALWGIHFSTNQLAALSLIGMDASAPVGIGTGPAAGGAAQPTFSTAFIKDGSITPKGVDLGGAYSVAGVEVSGTAPVGFSSTGTKTLAGIIEQSVTPTGLWLNGTYANFQIYGPGFYVDGAGRASMAKLNVTPRTPATSSAAGSVGDACWDANFLYVCTAANTWKRATLVAF